MGTLGETYRPQTSEWRSAWPHSLSGMWIPTRLEAQAEGRSEPTMPMRMRARGSRWWHTWNHPRTDGNTGIPEDAKNRAHQC